MDNCFLSLDEDQPLAIWWANKDECGAVPLDDFLEESKIDMSAEMAEKYANRLQAFVDELNEFATTNNN